MSGSHAISSHGRYYRNESQTLKVPFASRKLSDEKVHRASRSSERLILDCKSKCSAPFISHGTRSSPGSQYLSLLCSYDNNCGHVQDCKVCSHQTKVLQDLVLQALVQLRCFCVFQNGPHIRHFISWPIMFMVILLIHQHSVLQATTNISHVNRLNSHLAK